MNKDFNELFDWLDCALANTSSEGVLSYAIDTQGKNYETLCDVLYWLTGYRTLDQLKDADEEGFYL